MSQDSPIPHVMERYDSKVSYMPPGMKRKYLDLRQQTTLTVKLSTSYRFLAGEEWIVIPAHQLVRVPLTIFPEIPLLIREPVR